MYIFKNPQPGQTELATLTVNPPPAARGYPHAPKALQPVAVFGQKGSSPGEFNEPRSLAVDSAGNLLVMDTKNNRVQKLTPAGQVITTWGSQGDGPGQFKDPHGIAIGPDGSVYVADTWNHRIEKFDPNGKFLMQFGKEDPGFWGPRGIAVSKEGNVYVTDTGNKRVVSFSADGKLLETWGGDGSGQKQFIEPVGIAVNDDDEVVVCDTGNRRLQFFLSDGTFQREQPMYGWEEFYTEPYIAIVGDDILVTDSYDHRFARYRDGKLAGTWGKSGTGPGEFNRPIGIAAASPTTVYVSDTMNNRIQKFELPAE
jgi:DNA-binding beta-propeller fold protein YncE